MITMVRNAGTDEAQRVSLSALINQAVTLEWGSEAQIDAENAVFDCCEQAGVFTREEAEEACLKATVEEMMAWVLVRYNAYLDAHGIVRKPESVTIALYDLAHDMAVEVSGTVLIGYYLITSLPLTEHSFEWDNGFQFDFVTPDTAATLERLGYADVVRAYREAGCILEG